MQVRIRISMWLPLLLGVMTITGPVVPSQAEGPLEGKLQMVDSLIMRVTIQTDSGVTDSFSVTHPALLKGLAPGDRVRVFVGSDGMVSEVKKLETAGQQAPPAGHR